MRSFLTFLGFTVLLAGVSLAAMPDGGAAREPVAAPAVHSSMPDATYSGPRDGCRKCHLREYRSWERTPHADAFDLLSAEEKADPNCVRCHTTGYGQPGGFASEAETPALAGVTCEVCHGPGSEYRDKEIMKDRAASIAAGLVIPDENTCLACHNAESPTFSGSFDFEAAKEAGVHEIKR